MGLPLYLASESPRRRHLLTQAGIPFELFAVPVEEERLAAEYRGALERLGEYLAVQKALAAKAALVAQGKQGLVLAADTTVLLGGESLAKPRDRDEAVRMLRRLRGRTHTVATGVALAATDSLEVRSASSQTLVRMRTYSDEEIAAYVATGDPLDKAGAYSIQHPDFHPVERITGCYLGVIGLPVCLVAALLGGGPLPPVSGTTEGCMWSAACTEPYPTGRDTHERVAGDGGA